MDSDHAPWNATEVPCCPAPFELPGGGGWCPVPDARRRDMGAGRLSGRNGQACFWFNAGCAIGCPTCDGRTRGPIPNITCTRPDDPSEMCARKMPVCEDGLKMPKLPREARTVNVDAEDGAEDDWYQFAPWRAPGSAGVVDACGVAGGYTGGDGSFIAKYGVDYRNTTNAKRGDRGSQLPRRDTGTVWTAGDVVEVSWALTANHGGGYYWRLCRLPEDGSPVTEDCFQKTPLKFVGPSDARQMRPPPPLHPCF